MKKALQMVRDYLVMAAVLVLKVWGLMTGMTNAGEKPDEVPPCPPEYKGGLIP